MEKTPIIMLKILGITAQNLFAQAIKRPGGVDSYVCRVYLYTWTNFTSELPTPKQEKNLISVYVRKQFSRYSPKKLVDPFN
jgi:hypothetical protein